jgi:hypothetical protein
MAGVQLKLTWNSVQVRERHVFAFTSCESLLFCKPKYALRAGIQNAINIACERAAVVFPDLRALPRTCGSFMYILAPAVSFPLPLFARLLPVPQASHTISASCSFSFGLMAKVSYAPSALCSMNDNNILHLTKGHPPLAAGSSA